VATARVFRPCAYFFCVWSRCIHLPRCFGDHLHRHAILSFLVGCLGAFARIVVSFGMMCFVPRPVVVDVLLLAVCPPCMYCFRVLRNFQLLVSIVCSFVGSSLEHAVCPWGTTTVAALCMTPCISCRG